LNDIDLREVRIVPNGINYVCEIVYKKEIEINNITSNRIIGIDLGINNIITIANNIGSEPIVIKGGIIKSIIQFYNKEKARVQSIYDLAKIKYGGKLKRLDLKRNNKIKDYFHKLSRFVVNYCETNNISTIVIGYNPFWKQKSNIGKKNNQKFVQIPHSKLIQMIKYKAEALGIDVIMNEESYTSKCSFLDNESLEHHNKYLGKRIKRGLFRTSGGKIINADVNGALNIIRKAIPKAFANGIEGIGLYPRRYYI
jgi:putative transposase